MTKVALSLSAVALAVAGCTTYYDPGPSPAVTTSSGAPVVVAAPSAPAPAPVQPQASSSGYRAGHGLVESISLVTLPAAASAGGTLPPVVSGPYRVTVRMDEGSIQTMIVDNRAFLVGDRVQIMSDGRLIRP